MNIAILGLGVVGRGVFDILQDHQDDMKVKYILEVDQDKTKGLQSYLATSINQILEDQEVDVIVELIGGKKIAYEFVIKAIKAGKHVVTANKALISAYGKELHQLALKHQVELLYEASVGGGIIILDTLKSLNRIEKFYKIEGILNGSSNYVLSKIFKDHMKKDNAIKHAMDLGYLEKNSNDDLEGLDAIRKINILSMIAYQTYIDESSIIFESLDRLTETFIDYIKDKDLVIKYVATSEWVDGMVSIHLEPVIYDKDHMMAHINDAYNIINLYGKYHERQSFIGQGAGRYPTATAIIYDLERLRLNHHPYLHVDEHAKIDQKTKTFSFLVQREEGMHIIDDLNLIDLHRLKDIICYARIDEGAYEKL